VKILKKNSLFLFFLFVFSILVIVSCSNLPPIHYKNNVIDLDDKFKNKSYEEAQILAIEELYQFYHNRKSKLEFCEVISYRHRFLLNYDSGYQMISIETDLGSGWSTHFNKVSEAELQKVANKKVGFLKYPLYLSKFELPIQNRNKIMIVESYHNYFNPQTINGFKMKSEEFRQLQ
jgi:hypothetical protein